jgi:hypothetical protein
MSTTSARHRLVAVGRLADHHEVGLGVHDHGEPAAHQLLVVSDHHAHGLPRLDADPVRHLRTVAK